MCIHCLLAVDFAGWLSEVLHCWRWQCWFTADAENSHLTQRQWWYVKPYADTITPPFAFAKRNSNQEYTHFWNFYASQLFMRFESSWSKVSFCDYFLGTSTKLCVKIHPVQQELEALEQCNEWELAYWKVTSLNTCHSPTTFARYVTNLTFLVGKTPNGIFALCHNLRPSSSLSVTKWDSHISRERVALDSLNFTSH